MKKLMFMAVAIFATTTFADIGEMLETNDPNKVVFTTQLEDGSTNNWTQSDLVAALGLLNRKYHRDCEKVGGRRAWHGKLKREIINTNDLTKTEVYEDGTSFTYKFTIKTPAQSVKDYNSRLSTNGVPARITAARARRMKEIQTTNVVNQVLKAGE